MENFSGQKIAILGLGIEGFDLLRFFSKRRAKIIVFDQKEKKELGPMTQEAVFLGAKLKLGKDYLKAGLEGFDFIFRSPAFYRFLPQIVEAEKKGAIISSATKLFFDLCPAKIIGVTGTKGKGTTATLIYEILKKDKKKVYLAGNIGQPMLSLLPRLGKGDWVILELSSFQLIDLHISPHIAVVLNITVDHLDWHRDKKEYVGAKENIVLWQKRDDLAVINADYPTSRHFAQKTRALVFYFSRRRKVKGGYVQGGKIIFNFDAEKMIAKIGDLKLRGEHNLENITAASLAAWLAGASLAGIKKTLESFKGLSHRLELVKQVDGVKFYNDSFSTTPETAIAAIKSFPEPIILIAGGSEKGADYRKLGREIPKSPVKTLILIGQMAPRLQKAVEEAGGFKGKIIRGLTRMEEMVRTAKREAKAGDVVLLSPACASFDMFKNYKDRGEQFKSWVKKLR